MISLDFSSSLLLVSSCLFAPSLVALGFCFILVMVMVMLMETGSCWPDTHVYGPVWPVDHRNPPALSSQVLGLQECTTLPSSHFGFDSKHPSNSQSSLPSFLIKEIVSTVAGGVGFL